MANDGWAEVTATMLTTHHVEAYGGMRFARQALVQAEEQMNTRGIPMHVAHDLGRPLRVRHQRAYVEDVQEGNEVVSYLRIRYEIHPDDQALVADMQAFSAMFTEPLFDEPEANSDSVQMLAGNAAWFGDEALVAAAIKVEGSDLSIRRSYQFAFVPDPQLLIVVAYSTFQFLWASGVVGNALWDGLKGLMQSRRTPPHGSDDAQTVIDLEIADGNRKLAAQVRTNDLEIAKHALDRLSPTVDDFFSSAEALPPTSDSAVSKHVVVWDKHGRQWVAPR